LQKKEPEPKTPVAKAKKIVQQAIKQPKTTAKTAKPTVGAFKKGAVGELAKKIRKEGEAWPTALKRAGQMIKEQKSGVQKKANAQYKKLNSLLTKMPALRKGTDVERDAPRKAKPIGKRTAKSGSTYYEYRSNRTDVRQGKGYPYLKLGAMLAKGGEISKMYDEITMFDEISEKQISYIIKKMNEAKGPKNFDKELQKLVNWVWDNEPLLSKDQNVKGIKFLKNLAFMANGKSRSNSPFGSREEYTLKNFAYFKLRGFHDVSLYGQVEQYVPLYTVFDDEGYGFEYYYHAGKVNVVGAKGMTTKKGSVEVNFFDTDKKVKDFLNLSRVQFMARYKVTKDNYQKMVSAITRNIEGVFMHGGEMAKGDKVLYKYEETDDQDADYIFDESKLEEFLQEHNEYFDTDYKTIEEFNKGEVYRKITKLSYGGKMSGAGQFAQGGMMNKYDVVYNSYDQETGDLIADHESVYVMASSTSEAKNKAMTMLEEGSRDEDFTIVRVNGMMADGGMTKDFSGNYYSTNDFVGSNGLKDLANKVFGMGWEAEDDVDQIAELANHAGLKYVIINAQNRSEWNNYRQIDTAHPTNDSNYDIFVIANQDWKKYVNDSEGDSDYDDGEYAKGGHMAKGGITQHGLRVGDTIVSEIDANTIVVENPASGRRTINISTGNPMAKGGMSDKIVMLVKDKKGNVVLKTTSTNKAADYVSLHGRENFTVETLDGRKIMAKGGRMGFKALSEKVAKHYAGKSVPAKYQPEYGKFYDGDEAKTVGNKVAAKVYRLQQGK
jgi:hypothetical protein